MITIPEIIADTKKVEDIKGIKIGIQNKGECSESFCFERFRKRSRCTLTELAEK